MCVQLDDASIGVDLFNLIFDFWEKMQFIVFMLRVFRAHLSPVKCSKTIFSKRAKSLAPYRGTMCRYLLECELYKMPQERAWYFYLKHQLSVQVNSVPISIMYQWVLTTHQIPWHDGGKARQMYRVLPFCIVPLVRGKCGAFGIQRQSWQYKVKHDRWWRKLPWLWQKAKSLLFSCKKWLVHKFKSS